MRNKIVAGNWKMHFSPLEAKNFASKFPRLIKKDFEANVVIFAQSVLLAGLLTEVKKTKIQIGAQNCHWELQGAFTGETSPQTLKHLGIKNCLVGHSERRQLFGETILQTAQKVKTLHQLDITPMICVGETLAEREKGQTDEIVIAQLKGALKDADPKKGFIVAYEPVWAIGTGKVATPELAQQAHQTLRKFLADWKLGDTTILYGGSVKPDNAAGLAACPDIDGFLVGGASLEPESFANICLATLNAMR